MPNLSITIRNFFIAVQRLRVCMSTTFLLWYVFFSNFQLALVVSDKGGISAREFLSPMRSAQTHTHLFRLARSS
jgi:hypothetical protein